MHKFAAVPESTNGKVEITVQLPGDADLLPFEVYEIPRVGEVIKIAAKQPGPIIVDYTVKVRQVIHLLVPKRNEPRGNYHLVNVITEWV